MDESLMNRSVNEGFSGGEKKRNEILQMAMLEPKLAILDETDSGLDIDALRIVAQGVNAMRSPDAPFLVITHYQRLLDYIVPDFVHVLVDGDRALRRTGLALELEEKGYSWDRSEQARRHEDRDDGLRDLKQEHRDDGGHARNRSYLEGFTRLRATSVARGGREPVWLQHCARTPWRVSARTGFPTTHDEDWRFTNFAALATDSASAARPGRIRGFAADHLGLRACRARLPVGIRERPIRAGAFRSWQAAEASVCSLAKAMRLRQAMLRSRGIEQHLGRYADISRDVFTALNTALWEDGAYLRIQPRRGARTADPSVICFARAPAPKS